MNKEELIKEMARVVDGGCKESCEGCYLNGGCTNFWWAKEFYNAGYRKTSDVAKEIFEKLYANISFDGHSVSVWKKDLLRIAKEYDVNLE